MTKFSPTWTVFTGETGVPNLNLLGYGLLGMFVCSLAELFATAAFRDPAWQFEAVRRFTDISWALVLGVALVMRRTAGQMTWVLEAKLVRRLSQACIVFALLYLGLIAVTWSAFTHLLALDRVQTQAVEKRAGEQFRSLQQAVASADSIESLQKAVAQFGKISTPGQPLEPLKAGIVSQIQERRRVEAGNFALDTDARRRSRLVLAVRMIAQNLIMAFACLGLFHFRHRQQQV